jgi:hypothetical protein
MGDELRPRLRSGVAEASQRLRWVRFEPIYVEAPDLEGPSMPATAHLRAPPRIGPDKPLITNGPRRGGVSPGRLHAESPLGLTDHHNSAAPPGINQLPGGRRRRRSPCPIRHDQKVASRGGRRRVPTAHHTCRSSCPTPPGDPTRRWATRSASRSETGGSNRDLFGVQQARWAAHKSQRRSMSQLNP